MDQLIRNPTVVVAIIAAIGLVGAQVIVGVFTIVSNNRNARRQEEAAAHAQGLAENIAKADGKLDTIKVSVDGRLSTALQEIASLRGELSRIYPGNTRVQQQAADAKTDAKEHKAKKGD